MIDAWFSSSETITSSFVRIAATVPAFAVNPDWNISASSACLNVGEPPLELTVQRHGAGDRANRARCPAPSSSAAFDAAAFTRGWFASPR